MGHFLGDSQGVPRYGAMQHPPQRQTNPQRPAGHMQS